MLDRPTLTNLIDLTGRRAVVTGAAGGIGGAVAHRLGEAGASLVLADIDEQALKARHEEMLSVGMNVERIDVDVTDAEAAGRLMAEATRADSIDILVNAAGMLPRGEEPLVDLPTWDRILNEDLRGIYVMCRSAALTMKGSDRPGVILNIASTVGLRGFAGMPHYVAAKHGVVGLTAAMAGDLAPHGVRVLAIAPSIVDTPAMAARRLASRQRGDPDPFQQAVNRIPLGRMATTDEVARVALFCVSDLASFVTGITIPVDGGRLAWEP